MATPALKKEIIKKLGNTQDETILDIINKLLDKVSLDPLIKEKLTKRALKSEQNIHSGKVYTRSEAIKQLKR